MELIVECRSDPRRGEIPVRFGWPGRMRRVEEVLDCWQGERHRDFRLRADDGSVYILRHDLHGGSWQIHFFRHDPEDAATDSG
jgi:hypothetical protein